MTAAFAVALTIVLAALGLVLYLPLEVRVALALDHELRLSAQDLAALVSRPPSS